MKIWPGPRKIQDGNGDGDHGGDRCGVKCGPEPKGPGPRDHEDDHDDSGSVYHVGDDHVNSDGDGSVTSHRGGRNIGLCISSAFAPLVVLIGVFARFG